MSIGDKWDPTMIGRKKFLLLIMILIVPLTSLLKYEPRCGLSLPWLVTCFKKVF